MDTSRLAAILGSDRLSLAHALLDRARWVEEKLNDAETYQVSQDEETLTQGVLLDLKKALPQFRLRVFSRQDESRHVGADWMWWWQGSEHWFGHLVQAKRLHRLNGTGLGYKIGYRPKTNEPKNPKPRQIDTLLAAASALSVPAIYALYNPSTPGRVRAGSCPHVASGASAEGVTILSADVAKSLMHREATVAGKDPQNEVNLGLDALAEDARPWSCLATCTVRTCVRWPLIDPEPWWNLGFGLRTPTNDMAAGAATALLLARFAHRRRQAFLGGEELASGIDEIRKGVRPEPPGVVSALLDQGRATGLTDEFLRELPESVKGVVVVQPRVFP